MSAALEHTLRSGAQALALDLSEAQIAQLLDFIALLQKWNKVYNLTSVRDPAEMMTHHLLDSLAAVAPLQRPLARDELKRVPELRAMVLLQRGSRLSVQPVTTVEWTTIPPLGGGQGAR